MWFVFMAAYAHGSDIGVTRYLVDHAQYRTEAMCETVAKRVAEQLAVSDTHGAYACRFTNGQVTHDGPQRTF